MKKFNEYQPIKEVQINLEGCEGENHLWTNWFTNPNGLTQECKLCGKTRFAKIYKNEVIIHPPLDEFGFLDKNNLK